MLIPAAVGFDINCGMRFHVSDLTLDQFLAHKQKLVELLRGDYLLGTRDIPISPSCFHALFDTGLIGFVLSMFTDRNGLLAKTDVREQEADTRRILLQGSLRGDYRLAPESLTDRTRDVIRSEDLGTIGSGNHFVELQVVEEILDGSRAYAWGVKKGYVACMIHSGSRLVGKWIGSNYTSKAKAAWPKEYKFPTSGIFPIVDPDAINAYILAQATASNYGFVNRMLLAEMMRSRMREVFGESTQLSLVYDLPHNITLQEGDKNVTRKGACPAYVDQPVIIPGSMGASSYLMVGCGNERFLQSASHGAGRSYTRNDLHHQGMKRTEKELGLTGIECVTLREERRIEEAPVAYKDIDKVIDIQVRHGIVTPVARMRPLVTFKG
jgi:tRNA-splicing ligase RtcB